MATLDPYDELPYRALPIEWTAPERLAVASMLHGGPRTTLHAYRVLELGCADGSNLLPLAYYRSHATFIGVDGARSQVDIANARKGELGLSNVEFIAADFVDAERALSGQFDYIIGHGVFSWVPEHVRDALLSLCASRLRPGGLLYLNYNAYPGWKIRGQVREVLVSHTARVPDLRGRAQMAKDVAARIASTLTVTEHPYSRLISDEFTFVAQSHVSYVAHEYLTPDNHAYWRRDFMALARRHGLEFVGDADFNYSSGRIPEDVTRRLLGEGIAEYPADDLVDLLCYRQLHSPMLTTTPFARTFPTSGEFGDLYVASCLAPVECEGITHRLFQHPSGYQVEAKCEVVRRGLEALQAEWPRGLRVAALFSDLLSVIDDLKLLHRNGLIELRRADPCDDGVDPEPLRMLESQSGYATTLYHTRVDNAACVS